MPVLVAVVLARWGIGSCHAGAAPTPLDRPAVLGSIAVPDQPDSLAWSADGAYLAAGNIDSGNVFVVNVAKASVTATFKAAGRVQGLAFSPDGKWLAVITTPSAPAGATPGELVVLAVPAFTASFTAKAGGPRFGFFDLAWAADSTALYAIDCRDVLWDQTTAERTAIRRWAVPAFAERSAIRALKTGRYAALAVTPDGRTLAVAEDTGLKIGPQVVRLFDLDRGVERSSFEVGATQPFTRRLGFTPNGKAVGVFEPSKLSWWDVATGRPTEPDSARVAIPPAGLSPAPHALALSPDGKRRAHGYEQHPITGMGLNDILFAPKDRFGTFVRMIDSTTSKTWTWRVGELSQGYADAPAVAFSPDETRLAATVKQQIGGSILIWAVPK
ncbi:MAG TPA: WD40 repeat domain-containing protein [Isosphaeraceae bacterium]|nr:WD40 repeat domain-containing protein [Isosphaeraceae bacterium]